ncbi:MAG: hypothetical protein V1722_00330 [Candidatus Micrarchaeota archaeon]
MAEEPWHLKAARSLNGAVKPLLIQDRRVYGHSVALSEQPVYTVNFADGKTNGVEGAKIQKVHLGVSKRLLTVTRNGKINCRVPKLTGIKTLAALKKVDPRKTSLHDLPILIKIATAAHEALKAHQPK